MVMTANHMPNFSIIWILVLIGGLLISSCSRDQPNHTTPSGKQQTQPEESAGHYSSDPSGQSLSLSPKYRRLLQQEMLKIEGGMHTLLSHLVRGRNKQAAETALKIHNSFILKQELSKKELQDLQSQLPKPFIKMDKTFHKQAKQLGEACRVGDTPKAMSIYGKMTSGCTTCHARYATDRFPGLRSRPPDK